MVTESAYRPPSLLVPSKAPPRTHIGRWFMSGRRLDEPSRITPQPWYRVLWLTGVDYFSSLAYQPGIALLAAGALAPMATIWLVGLTIFGAVPIYLHVASRSYAGLGSIALLESMLEGWRAKVLVLILLGFACAGFIVTTTISAADAAVHAVNNPLFHPWLEGHQVAITYFFLGALMLVFFTRFGKAVGWAMAVAIPYVGLNAVLLVRCLFEIHSRGELLSNWTHAFARQDLSTLAISTALIFPRLALGLSGFETSLAVMPEVRSDETSEPGASPVGRIRATRKLLVTAAAIMSIALLTSSFAASLLIPETEIREGGRAAGRSLAYLAHSLLGNGFGTVYDVFTIVILWLAGASATVGMLNLIPRYLPRFGMAPRWIAYQRPLVVVVVLACAIVTRVFNADVEAQANAYATGVLALFHASGVAVAISLYRALLEPRNLERRGRIFLRFSYMCLVCAVFTYALVDTIVENADGVILSLAIAASIVAVGAVSRAWRSTELRVEEITFTDEQSAELWKSMVGKRVHVAPLRTSSTTARSDKAEEIRSYYLAEGPLAFLHVNLVDNRSDFLRPLAVTVRKEGENYVVEVFGAVAIANTIAYISELIDPISLFLGLTQQNLMSQSIKYVLWGEGETGLMVYMILLRYWRWTTEEEDVRPNIFLLAA